jgi:hypothetical protein
VSVLGVGLYRTTDGTNVTTHRRDRDQRTALGIATGPGGKKRLVAATVFGTYGTRVP